MSKIKVFARIKPSLDPTPKVTGSFDKIFIDKNDLRSSANSQIQYRFDFDGVFDQRASQEEVFNVLTKDVINTFLEGYNATVFAYGQTGSGKTFTIEGSAKQYCERGLIPRSLSYIFEKLDERSNEETTVHISFMEIYKEVAYDLLNPASRFESSLVTTLSKISIKESPSGQMIAHNLTIHLVADVKTAQNLMFQGVINRKVASTSMNIKSSRSHAVFSITFTAKQADSETFIISKLNFVDLAGSERVAKTKSEGQILSEAKFINLSLHYLEHVIILLQKNEKETSNRRSSTAPELTHIPMKKKSFENLNLNKQIQKPRPKKFIPYRNSLLTMFLKDSLGGNCNTCMIANITSDSQQLDETISTCRFAQRVACITNLAMKNEILDDKALIKKLKGHIKNLEDELEEMKKILLEKKECQREPIVIQSFPLSDDDKEALYKIVHSFIQGRISDPLESGIDTKEKITESLMFLREIIIQASKKKLINIKLTSENENPTEKITKQTDQLKIVNCINDKSNIDNESIKGQTNCNSVLIPDKYSFRKTSEDSVKSEYPKSVESSINSISTSIMHSYSPALTSNSYNTQSALNLNKPTDDSIKATKTYVTPYEQRKIIEIAKKVENLKKNEDEINKEKQDIFKTQLKIKENHIEQKLMVIRNQIKNQTQRITYLSQIAANIDDLENEQMAKIQLEFKEKELSQQLASIQLGFATHLSPKINVTAIADNPKKNFNQILQNLDKESKEQSKVKKELEQIKMHQFEKELEIKEENTRRKLFALKQQLKGIPQTSNPFTNTTYPTAIIPPTTISNFLQTKNTPNTDNKTMLIGQNFNRLNNSSHVIKNNITADEMLRPNLQQSNTTSNQNESNPFNKSTPPQYAFRKSNTAPKLFLHNTQHLEVSKESCQNKESCVTVIPSSERQLPKNCIDAKPYLRKEVDKEKDFMSAAQQQRARVQRIRKAINSAKIIQRAWRNYNVRNSSKFIESN